MHTVRDLSKSLLNKMGDEGWELVSVYDKVAYFKRRKLSG